MKTFNDSDATIEFKGQGIVHVCFKETGALSTHLLRELIVASKVQYGEAPKAIIFTVKERVESDRFFHKISTRSQQIAPGTIISLVCLSKSTLAAARTYLDENKPDYPLAVFSDFKRSLDWVECKLINTETIKTLSVQTILVGMTA